MEYPVQSGVFVERGKNYAKTWERPVLDITETRSGGARQSLRSQPWPIRPGGIRRYVE